MKNSIFRHGHAWQTGRNCLIIAFTALLCVFQLEATTITGRVSDEFSGSYLPGAVVTVEGTGRTTATNDQGRFTISGLEPGSYQVRANYLGYGVATETVQVGTTGAQNVDLELGAREDVDGTLEAFVIDGSAESRSRALQQKMTAVNFKEVISADKAGSLPDRNVAEALSRVVGVNLEVDSGEGRFISIRGVEPNLNNVTFNGSTMAPPSIAGQEGRAMPLDVIAASQISELEVIKSVTPDMEAQSLGGTVNVKTVSAYDRELPFVFGSFEFGENLMLNKDILQSDLTVGKVFGSKRQLGVALAGSYSERHIAQAQLQGSWEEEDGIYFLEGFDRDDREGRRDRFGLNLNLEYRPLGEDGDTRFYFRALRNEFDRIFDQQQFRAGGRGDPISFSRERAVFSRARLRPFLRVEEREQDLINLSLGGTHKFGNFTLEINGTFAFSEETVFFGDTAQFREEFTFPGGFVFDSSRFLVGPDSRSLGLFAANFNEIDLRRLRLNDTLSKEETWTPSIDLQYDFDDFLGSGRSGFAKVGFKYTDRDRFTDTNSVRPVPIDGVNLDVGSLNAAGPGKPFFDGQQFTPATIRIEGPLAFFEENPDLFEVDPFASLENSLEEDFEAKEEILALYAMLNLDVTPKLNILVGVRYEDTDVDLAAYEFIEGEGLSEPSAERRSGSQSYENIHPNFQAKYKITELQQVRFAFTSTVGRPDYGDAAPISALEFDVLATPDDPDFPLTGSRETGNPELQPFESINLDLAYEYFLRSGGVLSLGLFYKDIDDPIFVFSEEQDNVVIGDRRFETLQVTETRNADSGEIKGIEFNAQVPFSTFLSADSILSSFGVDFNLTLMDSEVDVFDREDENLPLFRQPDEIVNAAIYYQQRGLEVRFAYNHQSEQLWELEGNPDEDVWKSDRHFFDAQASYRINDNIQLIATWKNITNETKEFTLGIRDLVEEVEIFGSEIRIGTRFNF